MRKKVRSSHPIPVRMTLADQAADCIRQGLREGRWEEVLPSEGEMCRELGVSRGTLRRALEALFAEGCLVPGGRGLRHTLARKRGASVRPRSATKGDLVRILSPQPRFMIAGLTNLIFQTFSESLGRGGLHVEFDYHPGLWKLRRPASALRKITSQPDTAAWLLYRSTHPVQNWFARSEVPAVVLGGIYPDVALSHGEFDLVAASRHAAGMLMSRGHRRMVFLTVDKATAGDDACAKVFQETAAAAGGHAEVAIYDDTVPGLCHTLDGTLMERPIPSAYFVAMPNHVPATIGHLTRRGFPVPKSAVVISRMDARLLSESIPSVARYALDAERLGRGLARLILQATNPASMTSPKSCVIMPDFVDGETGGGEGGL